MTTDIDKLRRDLHLARKGLADCTKALAASEEREHQLRDENNALKQRMRSATRILGLDEDQKLRDVPGACGACGSFTCGGTCWK